VLDTFQHRRSAWKLRLTQQLLRPLEQGQIFLASQMNRRKPSKRWRNSAQLSSRKVASLPGIWGAFSEPPPEDAVGLVLGDPLHFVRTVIARTLDQLISKIFERRGVTDTQPVSPSLAIPLLRAAYDESRPELQQLWADLIAAAMDPKRSGRVRLSFIDTLKRFDPLDALLLKGCRDRRDSQPEPDAIEYFMKSLNTNQLTPISRDEKVGGS
jgi:hypothetical protein